MILEINFIQNCRSKYICGRKVLFWSLTFFLPLPFLSDLLLIYFLTILIPPMLFSLALTPELFWGVNA